MKKKKEGKFRSRFSLSLSLAAIVFAILLVTILLAELLFWGLIQLRIIPANTEVIPDLTSLLWFIGVFSIVFGTGITMVIGRIPLQPIDKLISKLNGLASGDFSTRIHFKSPLKSHPAFAEIEESFNTMAEELQNTEMLRADFVNNLSHEFKTPIVSIAGFAKLLKHDNLTDAQKAEYIDAIEEESLRLSHMATNVLNLTKVENQTILTDVTKYNVSEQLRSAVLLLEPLWTKKNLDLRIDFEEYEISANEELLKQVWINLIENAAKFSPEGGPLEITITPEETTYRVKVSNIGHIPEASLKKIWNKFYQADESHHTMGNGIGLAVVKHIVELHNGTVDAENREDKVFFTVTLPKEG